MGACLFAAGLIATCVGYVPASGSTIYVTRKCTADYSDAVRASVIACAKYRKVRWRYKRG